VTSADILDAMNVHECRNAMPDLSTPLSDEELAHVLESERAVEQVYSWVFRHMNSIATTHPASAATTLVPAAAPRNSTSAACIEGNLSTIAICPRYVDGAK
jgi:hypothetical protein